MFVEKYIRFLEEKIKIVLSTSLQDGVISKKRIYCTNIY